MLNYLIDTLIKQYLVNNALLFIVAGHPITKFAPVPYGIVGMRDLKRSEHP